jgi:selenocysteine lyase/cysteine desulfurase
MTRSLMHGLSQTSNITVYGPGLGVERAAVVSFNIHGMDAVAVASELERRADIACRPGLHCAWLAHKTLGTESCGTVRLSPGPGTTVEEIEIALGAIEELARGH